jgi:hypothetical protein
VNEYAPFTSVVVDAELVPERLTVTPEIPVSTPLSNAPFPFTSL